jgi:hypothetical protein
VADPAITLLNNEKTEVPTALPTWLKMLYEYCCYACSTFGGELFTISAFFSSTIGMSYFGGGFGLFSAPIPSASISSKLPSFSGSFSRSTPLFFSLKLN